MPLKTQIQLRLLSSGIASEGTMEGAIENLNQDEFQGSPLQRLLSPHLMPNTGFIP